MSVKENQLMVISGPANHNDKKKNYGKTYLQQQPCHILRDEYSLTSLSNILNCRINETGLYTYYIAYRRRSNNGFK